MKLQLIYRPNSDQVRVVEEFAHEFERIHAKNIELVSLDTREGALLAQTYDILQSPAILALRDDGQLVQLWAGESLPLMDEVAAYR